MPLTGGVPAGSPPPGSEHTADRLGAFREWKEDLNRLIEQHIFLSAKHILAGVAVGQLGKPRHVHELLTSGPANFVVALGMLGFQTLEPDPLRLLALTKLEGLAPTRTGIQRNAIFLHPAGSVGMGCGPHERSPTVGPASPGSREPMHPGLAGGVGRP